MKKNKNIKNLFKFNVKTHLIKYIRIAFLRSKVRSQVFNLYKKERGQYQCNKCKCLFKRNELQVDHIIPVIDIKKGFEDFTTYINNMFGTSEKLELKYCDLSKFQLLCKKCHEEKTKKENERR
jgi:5-methylcytosine-specific restriction endonuclease McrA